MTEHSETIKKKVFGKDEEFLCVSHGARIDITHNGRMINEFGMPTFSGMDNIQKAIDEYIYGTYSREFCKDLKFKSKLKTFWKNNPEFEMKASTECGCCNNWYNITCPYCGKTTVAWDNSMWDDDDEKIAKWSPKMQIWMKKKQMAFWKKQAEVQKEPFDEERFLKINVASQPEIIFGNAWCINCAKPVHVHYS